MPKPGWTPEQREIVAACLRRGETASEIRRHFPAMTRNAVIGRVQRDPILAAIGFAHSLKKGPAVMEFQAKRQMLPHQRAAILAVLKRAGTIQECAHEVSVSREIVSRWIADDAELTDALDSARRTRLLARRAPDNPNPLPVPSLEEAPAEATETPAVPFQRPLGTPLCDLKAHQCRYPLDQDDSVVGRYLFCAEATGLDSVYCRRHKLLTQPPMRGRAAA